MEPSSRTKLLREIMAREGSVVPVYGVPTAKDGKLMAMKELGPESSFIGIFDSSIALANYTGLTDTGVAGIDEQIRACGYVARAVPFPVLLDGDTGHGGVNGVVRLVEEAITAGIAGLLIEDQSLRTKRPSMRDGIIVVSADEAIERFGAAVAARDRLDPNFVIVAECYANEASNSSFDDCLQRMDDYVTCGGVDWVQMTCPSTHDEIRSAHAAVSGFFSVTLGALPAVLTLAQHQELDLDAAWYNFFPENLVRASLWDAAEEFFAPQGIDWWTDFHDSQSGNPFATERSVDIA